MRGRFSTWIVEDPHRARVAFGIILGLAIPGLSIATVYLAVTGPAWRWLVAAGAFASGVILVLVLVRVRTQQRANAVKPAWIGLCAGVAGVLIDSVPAVLQIAVVAAANGYLVGLAVVARRRVLEQAHQSS